MKHINKKIFAFLFVFLITCAALSAYPKRIVSLSPAGTEVLFAVGAQDQIVARTKYCNYPEAAKDLPSVGGFSGSSLSIETILSYDPDFIYGTKGQHEQLAQQLSELGIEIYLSDGSSVESVINEIKYIGEVTGHKAQGKKVADNISNTTKKIATKVKKAKCDPVSVYYEVWGSPYMSVGHNSFIADVITTSGGNNIFGDITESAYPVVSEEEIIARNPTVIFVPAENGETIDSISARNGWDSITAVENKAIVLLDSDIVSRPGPRITQAMIEIAKALYPSIDFSDIKF